MAAELGKDSTASFKLARSESSELPSCWRWQLVCSLVVPQNYQYQNLLVPFWHTQHFLKNTQCNFCSGPWIWTAQVCLHFTLYVAMRNRHHFHNRAPFFFSSAYALVLISTNTIWWTQSFLNSAIKVALLFPTATLKSCQSAENQDNSTE